MNVCLYTYIDMFVLLLRDYCCNGDGVEHSVKGHVACMGHYRNAFTILVKRHEESRALETANCRWEDIEMAVEVSGI